jgi:hypothetical protein
MEFSNLEEEGNIFSLSVCPSSWISQTLKRKATYFPEACALLHGFLKP